MTSGGRLLPSVGSTVTEICAITEIRAITEICTITKIREKQMSLLEVLAAIAIVLYVIARQFLGETLRARRVVVLPAILLVVGITGLHHGARHPTPTDYACIATGAALAAAIGLAQGIVMRLEDRDGFLWGRMPKAGLWLWLALIASRLLFTAVAAGLDAKVAASSAPILLTLGANRLAMAGVIVLRAQAMGVPFAPDGGGLIGSGSSSGSAGSGGLGGSGGSGSLSSRLNRPS